LENPQDPKSPGKETQTSQEIRVSHRWFLTMVDWSIWKINHWYFLQLQICEYLIDVDGKLNVCPFARNIYICNTWHTLSNMECFRLKWECQWMSHVPPQSSTTNPESKETSAKGGKIWEDPNMGLTRKYVPLNPLLHAHFPY
jgi:hypothetical protein